MTPPFEPVYRTFSRVVYGAQLIVWVLAIVFGVGYCVSAKHAVQREAVAESTIHRLERDRARLTYEASVVRTQYIERRDTVLVRATRYDTLRATVDVHDTVQVVRVLAVADSTVHACRLLVTSCEARGRIDSLTIANRDSLVTATRALIPTRMDRVRGAAKWAAFGAAAVAILKEIHR